MRTIPGHNGGQTVASGTSFISEPVPPAPASAKMMKAAVKEFQRHLPSGWRHMAAGGSLAPVQVAASCMHECSACAVAHNAGW